MRLQFTEKQINWMLQKWNEGYTQKQIADALYIDVKTVYRKLKPYEKERVKLTAPPEIIAEFGKANE